MKLIDTHCHIDSSTFDADRERVLSGAAQNNVKKIIVPATTKNHWQRLLSICEQGESQHPTLFPALGLHPVYLEAHKTAHLAELEQQLENPHVVAVGEIGLDYYIKELDKAAQRELLDGQFLIAAQRRLPVILHCRKAYDDLIAMLIHHQLKGGIAHAFNGSIQQAHKMIDLGFKLGFGGMLTYQRSVKIRKLAKDLPLSSIVLETDSPDLTVVQHRGQRNSPQYLPFIIEALAQVRSEPMDELAFAIYQNSLTVFQSKI